MFLLTKHAKYSIVEGIEDCFFFTKHAKYSIVEGIEKITIIDSNYCVPPFLIDSLNSVQIAVLFPCDLNPTTALFGGH